MFNIKALHLSLIHILPLLVETPEADYEVESMDDRVIDKVKLTLKEKKESESQEEEE